MESVGTVVAVQGDSEDHLHLDPAQPRGHRRHLHPDGERRAKWQPGHLLDRRLGAREAAASRVPPSPSSPSGPASSTPTRPATPTTEPPPRSSSPSPSSVRQSITFTSTPPSPAVIGGTYTPTANGGASGNPVTFSIDASAKGSCSISGATVTFVAVGTCVIDANQAGNANYEAATQVQQSFAVLGTQSITFTSTPPSPAVIGGTYIPTANGGASGNPVTFSIDPSAQWKLQHLGCHRHLRRRRDLRHRRQPGRQRQLRGRHPGPAVLRSGHRYPEHHLHLDPAQPRGRRRHLHPHGERRGEWQPGHLLDRPVGQWELQHLGCHRHLRRRRDLRHRRQPGRQRQLRGRHPGPAVLRSGPWNPDHYLHVDPAQPRGHRRHLHRHGEWRGEWQPGHLLDRPLGQWELQHLGCDRHLRRRRDLRHRRQPGRQRQLRSRHPGPAVLRSGHRRPEHHLHLDPAQPRGRRRHLRPHGERRGEWQPGHLLGRRLGEWELQHLGCHRHLRRRRDLRHRRQPGRQRQLRGRHPGPAVLRRARHPEHHLHLDPAQAGGHRRHLPGDGERRGERQPGHLLDRLLGEGKLQHLGCHRHLRRRRDLRHRRQPGRQRQLRSRHPGPAVLRRARHPEHHLHLDPAQARRSSEAPTR